MQAKRGGGDFEKHVQGQGQSRADDMSSDSVGAPKDSENTASDATQPVSDEAQGASPEPETEVQDVAEAQVSADPLEQPEDVNFASVETEGQTEGTTPVPTAPAESAKTPVDRPAVDEPQLGASEAEPVAPTSDGADIAVDDPSQGLVEKGAEDAAATDPLVGLANPQTTSAVQASAASFAQPAQQGGRGLVQGAELARTATQPAADAGDDVSQAALAGDLKLKAGASGPIVEPAVTAAASRTAGAVPIVPVPTWGAQPAAQPTRPAAPSASGLMTAAGVSLSAQTLGASLFAAGADEASTGLAAPLAGVTTGTERGSDMLALPQMLTEASVRAGSSTAYRDGTPRFVAVQLAEAAMQGKPKVDVVLNPQELGNVTMRLSTTETGIAMVIQAERPETEELMRRHIHELEKEFKEMGFDNVEFNFAGSGAEHSGSSEGSSGDAGEGLLDGDALTETEQETALIGGHLNLAAEVLDMRV